MAGREVSKTKEDKNTPKIGPCLECERGYVMSDGVKGNPLIIECSINNTRYSQSWTCRINAFLRRAGELTIHPMIYLNRKAPSM